MSMTIGQLRERIAAMPDHWPVCVALPADGSGGGAETKLAYVTEFSVHNMPTQGNILAAELSWSDDECP